MAKQTDNQRRTATVPTMQWIFLSPMYSSMKVFDWTHNVQTMQSEHKLVQADALQYS